jgi:hypothetical protein
MKEAGMDDRDLRQRAEKRVEEKKSFFWDLGAYIVINAGLFIIWFFTGAGYPWFVWPLLGWGIGLVFHFLSVFVFGSNNAWHEKQVEKEMDRLRRQGKN